MRVCVCVCLCVCALVVFDVNIKGKAEINGGFDRSADERISAGMDGWMDGLMDEVHQHKFKSFESSQAL